MGPRSSSAGMRADPVLELARRSAVRLSAWGGAALSVASAVQVVAGEPAAAITLVAAVPTTLLAIAMLRQDRPNVIALLSLITSFALVAEIVAALRGESAYVAGIGAEVVVFGLGILAVFIARRRPRAVAVGFLAAAMAIVLVSQLHLNGPTLEIVSDIVVLLAVLGTLMYLVIRVMESLSASRTRYSDLANVIPVATFELDVSQVVRRINDLGGDDFAALTSEKGRDEFYEQLIGLIRMSYSNNAADSMAATLGEWREFVSGANSRAFRYEATRVITAVWQGITAGAGEVTLRQNDGSELDFIYRWALGQAGGRAIPGTLVVAATDVTRLRRAERELAQQLQERDQFVASVSHELRTPLTSIMGLTEELVGRPDDFAAEEQSELLNIVAAEARDVVDIVEDLLVTARVEAGQLSVNLEPCDLGQEARRVADLLGVNAVSAVDTWTAADPVRLRQVLRNLMSNALRHGGPNVRALVHQPGSRALFEVRDDGPPLPAAERERIFEAYERAGDSGVVGSVGLGLHVARVLARLMDGDLTYHHDGSDSIFRLELPVVAKPGGQVMLSEVVALDE